MRLDEMDRKILSELSANARISSRELARKLKISRPALLKRKKRLEEGGIIRGYGAALDYGKIGTDMHIIVMMKVKERNPCEMEHLEALLEMDELEAMYVTIGEWDVMSFWKVKDWKHHDEIMEKVNEHPAITKASSRLLSFAYKTPGR